MREEVWKDSDGHVVRYNLAFINHHLFAGDNGRVLGYDTAHGYAHRHFAGTVVPIAPLPYTALLERFSRKFMNSEGEDRYDQDSSHGRS